MGTSCEPRTPHRDVRRSTPRGGRTLLIAATAAVLVAAVGCTRDPDVRVDPIPGGRSRTSELRVDDIRLVRAEDCEQLVTAAEERAEAWRDAMRQRERFMEEMPTAMEDSATSGTADGSGGDAVEAVPASGPAATTMAPASGAASSDNTGSSDKAASNSEAAAEDETGGTVIAGTNNQEAGVDEGDMVKTDGRRLVVLGDDGTLRVVVLDDSPTVDGSVSVLPGGATSETRAIHGGGGAGSAQLLLRDDEAVTVVPEWSSNGLPVVTISRVDLADASAPMVAEQSRVAGELVATRMTGVTDVTGGAAGAGDRGSDQSPVVRIVIRPILGGRIEPVPVPTVTTTPETTTTSEPTTTEPTTTSPTTTEPTTTSPTTTEPSTTVDPGKLAEVSSAAARLLPQRVEADGTTSPIGTCSDVLSVPAATGVGTSGDMASSMPAVDGDYGYGYGSTSGVTVLTAGETLGDLAPVTVEGGAETVYATTDALYTTLTAWGADGSATAVHRFDLTSPGAATYTGSGLVPGTMLDQYSLSDRGGALRVVTTATTTASAGTDGTGGSTDVIEPVAPIEPDVAVTTTAGRLTVLRPDDGGTLREVGHLDDLGVGEEVKSVRFLEDRAYVVTFRQTDPLFAIDLADDTAPRLLGELKMPGFSEYLHPLGDGRLLGIGSDADPQTGRVTGFKASLFDVSDPTAPKELDSIVEADRRSSVGDDPHAFTWDPVRSQAIVPVGSTSFEVPDCPEGAACSVVGIDEVAGVASPCPPNADCAMTERSSRWSGADVIAVDGDSLVLRGTISQDIGGVNPDLLRSVIVDSTIWSVSAMGVGGHGADDLRTTATVRF